MKRYALPVFGIVGWKNSGKTTMTTRLVAELTGRGFRVSTVKHAHHSFEIDHDGTDSFRHRMAGASEVAVVSGARWAIVNELRGDPEPSLEEIVARLAPCDLVMVEGYKGAPHPKLEMRRIDARQTTPLWPDDGTVVALASDHPLEDCELPKFALEEIAPIADLVTRILGLAAPASRT